MQKHRRMHRCRPVLFLAVALTSSVLALPEGGQVVNGQVQISQPQGNVLQILQSSPQAILNWNSFNIASPELVQFLQPGTQAVLLNRVTGQDPSSILGAMQANGRIFLVNPNGVLFGPDSQVNAGSFVVSTLALSDRDFLDGNYRFALPEGETMRAIVNQGRIEVAPGGFAVLLSPLLDNQGLIVAEQGQVVLGATRQATLSVDAQGLLSVTMPDGFRGDHKNTSPGTVLVTPGQMSETLAQVVNARGLVEAGQVVDTPDGVRLEAAEGVLLQQGQIQAPGGSILLNSSQATVHDRTGELTADHGRIDVLSAGSTWSAGGVRSRGGFVEISAPQLTVRGAVDVGDGGTLLLDPGTLTIQDTPGDLTGPPFAATGANHSVSNATLGSANGAVLVTADDDIFLLDNVIVNFINNPTSVTFTAGHDIILYPGSQLNLQNNANLNMDAGNYLQMNTGSSVSSTSSASVFNATATTMDLTSIGFNNIDLQATGLMRFNDGNLGRNGAFTTISADANDLLNSLSTQVLGSGYDINFTGQNQLTFETGSSFILPAGAGNLTLYSPNAVGFQANASMLANGPMNLTVQADNFISMQDNTAINNLDPGSRGTFISPVVDVRNLSLNELDLQGTASVRMQGIIGRLGSPTSINVTAPMVRFASNAETLVAGSSVDMDLAGTMDVALEAGSRVQFVSPSTSLNVTGAPFIIDTGGNLTTVGSMQFDYNGPRFSALNGSMEFLGAGSVVNINPTISSAQFGNVTVAGDFNVQATAGNIRVGPTNADNIHLITNHAIIGFRPDSTVNATLNAHLVADNIYGNLTDPQRGLAQALTVAGAPGANVTVTVNGPNLDGTVPLPGDPQRPTVAGSLYRTFPQDQNFVLNRGPGAGDVVVVNQPDPNASPAPAPAPPPQAIESREDLTPAQQGEVLQDSAQLQLQLGNVETSVVPVDDYWEGLDAQNDGLVSFYASSLVSATVETVTLSPADAEESVERREGVVSGTSQSVGQRDEDEEDLRYWRYLVEHILIWEDQ